MKSLAEWLQSMFVDETLIAGCLTAPVRKGVRRIDIRPVELKGRTHFQFAAMEGNRVTHTNLLPSDAAERASQLLAISFRQGLFHNQVADVHAHMRKDGTSSLSERPPTRASKQLALHNRTPERMLPEGKPVDFLVHLGVMTQEGRVISAMYDKYRQINRYLEIVDDVAAGLTSCEALRIVDFGSGKSYLTFALYYYFTELKQRSVCITGLDLKEEVIERCNGIAAAIGYTELHFEVGDIAGYSSALPVDMVVSLHACDTATDDALIWAVERGARVILAVPCCQHELYPQIRNEINRPLLKYGILKERLASLVTDALRAGWLEQQSYTVQVLEFVDSAHTPKNLMIRASLNHGSKPSIGLVQEFASFRDFWAVTPRIERLNRTMREDECVPREDVESQDATLIL